MSESSTDSFGDFDELCSAPPPALESPHNFEMDVGDVTDKCFSVDTTIGWAHHSSPKKLLDRNFVWAQVC